MTDASATDVGRRIERALRAGVRGIALATGEEDRALELLEAVAERLGWDCQTMSATSGAPWGAPLAAPLAAPGSSSLASSSPASSSLAGRLLALSTHTEDALWVLLDAQDALQTPVARRALRELAQRERGPAVVLVDPPHVEPPLMPELMALHLPPPDLDALTRHLDWIVGLLTEHEHPRAREHLGPHLASLARAAQGLSRRDVERLVAEAVLDHGPDPHAVARFIAAAKPATLDREGMLEQVEPVPAQELGGLLHLKRWLERRALALRPAAASQGIPAPRGVLLLGVQGCGKSLAARVAGSLLDLPVVRLEPGRLFAGTVGASEANLRRTLALVERLAPVVLWLDEIDKGLAGTEGAASDAGTAARVVGGLLTWLQERRRPVFVAATANRVDALPPELLRRGRLDEIFFVDLPDADAREAILRVHLEHVPRRRLGHVPPTASPWTTFAEIARDAEGFCGAEIEAALVEARLDAFAEDRPLSAEDLRRAMRSTVPLSRTRAESIAALRAWATDRARRA